MSNVHAINKIFVNCSNQISILNTLVKVPCRSLKHLDLVVIYFENINIGLVMLRFVSGRHILVLRFVPGRQLKVLIITITILGEKGENYDFLNFPHDIFDPYLHSIY